SGIGSSGSASSSSTVYGPPEAGTTRSSWNVSDPAPTTVSRHLVPGGLNVVFPPRLSVKSPLASVATGGPPPSTISSAAVANARGAPTSVGLTIAPAAGVPSGRTIVPVTSGIVHPFSRGRCDHHGPVLERAGPAGHPVLEPHVVRRPRGEALDEHGGPLTSVVGPGVGHGVFVARCEDHRAGADDAALADDRCDHRGVRP